MKDFTAKESWPEGRYIFNYTESASSFDVFNVRDVETFTYQILYSRLYKVNASLQNKSINIFKKK